MERTEKPLSKSVAFRGSILNLRIDKVETPGGKRAVREVVEHAPAVAVLPVGHDGTVYLIRQYRYAVGRDLLKFPQGWLNREDLKGAPSESRRRRSGFFRVNPERSGVV